MTRASLVALSAIVFVACSHEHASDVAPPAASSSPPVAAASAPSSASAAPVATALPPPASITPSCCTMDRAEGHFGPENQVQTRYVGDYLRRKDGERLLFPQDLISDTKELYQHAKLSNRSITQERKVRVIGEGAKYVSVEIEDRGETGTRPFAHSACRTVDLRTGKRLEPHDVLGDEADQAIADAKKRLEAIPGHESYRFLSSSFAMIGTSGDVVRFCAPTKDEGSSARMDVEVKVR